MKGVCLVENNAEVDVTQDLVLELVLFTETHVLSLQLLHSLVHSPCSLFAAFVLIKNTIFLKLQIRKISHEQISKKPENIRINLRILPKSTSCK